MADDLFGEIGNLFTKNTPITSETPCKNLFIINRFLSMYSDSAVEAFVVNQMSNWLPAWAAQATLIHTLPQRPKGPFIKYIGKRPKEDEKVKELIDKVQGHFKCKRIHAVQIVEVAKAAKYDLHSVFGLKTPQKRKEK